MSVAPRQSTRRALLGTALSLAGSAALAACAPAAAPAPSPAISAPPAAQAGWEAEWDRLLAAAKVEGKLGILTLTGTGYRKTAQEFQDRFGITVEHQAESSGSIWVPKMSAERKAGVYSVDVVVAQPVSALQRLKPEGAWDPVRPLIFRPDVLNESSWFEGFDARFMDLDKTLAFAWEYNVNHSVVIDTNQVKPDEIKNVRDSLNPKWKGKLMIVDVRVGSTFVPMDAIREQLPDGDAVVKQLLVDQQPTFLRDARQRTEAVVRGRFPIGLGLVRSDFKEFDDQGLTKQLKFLDLPDIDYVNPYIVMLCNKAPNPNAAKLFVNWLLTKEGQTALCGNLPTNSARTDVQAFDPDGVPAQGRRYFSTSREATYPKQAETQKFINGLAGVTDS